MEVSSRRVAIVQHFHLPARGLLSIAAAVFLCVITRNVITRNCAVITWGRISSQVIPAKVKKGALGIWPL